MVRGEIEGERFFQVSDIIQSILMSINHGLQGGVREGTVRSQNHCEYFESLQQKLLEESQKLTNFMGKSLINDKSKTKLKLALSPARDQNLTTIAEDLPSLNRRSLKTQINHNQQPYLKRVKQLCQKIRSPKAELEDNFRSPQKPLREKYENERNLAYNISNFRKEERRDRKELVDKDRQITEKRQDEGRTKITERVEKQMEAEKPQKIEKLQRSQELSKMERADKCDKSDKIKRLYKMISETKSLKDTISTESCKSLKSLDQISTTSIYQEKLKLEDFEIIKYLAEGKFGSVYLVRHKYTNFLCALKRIPNLTLRNDPKVFTQRIREIKIQSYLDHPNIVQLYAVFVEDSDLYLLMELCYSGTLYHYLKSEGRLNQERIRGIIKQVCYAVEYMHDNDILHRDLKPQNILFHESIAKICDFGWSVNSPLLRDTLCGTPLYSSPELVQKQQYDNKVDIWNIGVLTYELLYGKVPFQIRTQEDLSKVIDDDIYFPRSKPASLEIKDFILRCLSKNPKERFSIAKLIDHEFLNPSNKNS